MALVLIIDDDNFIRSSLSIALNAFGHRTIEATNGAEGLERFHQTPVDLVVTDLTMPVKCGLDVISELKKVGASAKIIAISGQDANGLEEARRLGADFTLRKPFFLPDFVNTVNASLAG